MKTICSGLHQISLGTAHVFLLCAHGDLVLIDAGPEDMSDDLLSTLRREGVVLSDLDHIVVTHSHQDHAGGLRAVQDATGAETWMHPADAALVEEGRASRDWSVTPHPFQHVLYWLFVHGVPETVPATTVDHEVEDGDIIPVAGGLEVVHVPGHCEGQIALVWPRHGGVLFAADAGLSLLGRPLRSVVYEDLQQGLDDLRRLGTLDVDTAVFGHGAPITENAAERFRKAFS